MLAPVVMLGFDPETVEEEEIQEEEETSNRRQHDEETEFVLTQLKYVG